MGVTQLDMTSPKWSASTATRWDTLQGNAEDLGTKIAGTGIKTTLEGPYMADDEVPTNMALMAFSDSEALMVEVVGSLKVEALRSEVAIIMMEVVVGEEVPWPKEVAIDLPNEECLEGCVGASGGEVNEGGDDFGVSKSLLGEIPIVVMVKVVEKHLEMMEEPFEENRLRIRRKPATAKVAEKKI
ncbi:hypothetical protein Tco_0793110 [Tanacetum coccineum]